MNTSTNTAAHKAILVSDGDTQIDATLSPVIRAADLSAVSTVLRDLAMNFMAGNVHAAIIAANDAKGGIGKAFPAIGQGNKQAIRDLLPLKSAVIRKAWATLQKAAKRKTPVSLQALAKACKPTATTAPESFKAKVVAWAEKNPAQLKTLPVALFDLIAEILPEEKV